MKMEVQTKQLIFILVKMHKIYSQLKGFNFMIFKGQVFCNGNIGGSSDGFDHCSALLFLGHGNGANFGDGYENGFGNGNGSGENHKIIRDSYFSIQEANA